MRAESAMSYLDFLNSFHRWLKGNYLPGNARLLYYSLLAVFNEAQWPDQVQIDNFRLMSMLDTRTERVAIAARDSLVEAGLIEYSKGKKRSPNAYRLKFTHQKVSESVSESVSVSGSVSVQKTVSHKKKKEKEKESFGYPSQNETEFGNELQDAFEAWLAYKAEKRQAYKSTGLKSLVTEIRNHADKFGEEAVADLIRECMASNWQGIIFNRLKQGGEQLAPAARRYDAATGTWR